MSLVEKIDDARVIRHLIQYPFRFKTAEDGARALLHIQRREPIPNELIIQPFLSDGVVNPEYSQANFEFAYLHIKEQKVVDAD